LKTETAAQYLAISEEALKALEDQGELEAMRVEDQGIRISTISIDLRLPVARSPLYLPFAHLAGHPISIKRAAVKLSSTK
jgi:hypothetical protein